MVLCFSDILSVDQRTFCAENSNKKYIGVLSAVLCNCFPDLFSGCCYRKSVYLFSVLIQSLRQDVNICLQIFVISIQKAAFAVAFNYNISIHNYVRSYI